MFCPKAAQTTELIPAESKHPVIEKESVLQQQTAVSPLAALGSNPNTNLGWQTNGRLARAGNTLLQLQNQFGNRYVQQLINPQQRLTIQPKLMLGNVDTPSEREADQIAAQMGSGQVSSAPTPVNGSTLPVSPETENAISQARGGGQPLPENTRAHMEQSLGTDLSGVRVHTDNRADTLNQTLQAKAFTTGQDIFFRQGGYNPGSSSGQNLLAHELTHVAQQNQGNHVIQRKIYASAKVGLGKKQILPKDAYQHLLSLGIPNRIASALTKWYGQPDEDITLGDLITTAKETAAREASNLKTTAHQPAPRQEAYWEEQGAMMPGSSAARSPQIANWAPPPAAWQPPAAPKISGGSEEKAFGKDNDEWQPIKMGIKDNPSYKVTEEVVRNDEVDSYIPRKKQEEILDKIARYHGTGGPIKPAYWVRDALSSPTGPLKEISYQGLRPMIFPESFPNGLGTKKYPPRVYRGSGLNPMQLLRNGGFRAWGTDMDFYYHTTQEQTARQHSGYVATSKEERTAIHFAREAAQDDGYVYEIDLEGRFRLDISGMTQYEEDEWVVPYWIPFEHIRRVMPLQTNKWVDLSKQKSDIDGFEENISILSQLNSQVMIKSFDDISKSISDFEGMHSRDMNEDYDALTKEYEFAGKNLDAVLSILSRKDKVIDVGEFIKLLRQDERAKRMRWEANLINQQKIPQLATNFKIFLVRKGYIGIRLEGETIPLTGPQNEWFEPLTNKLATMDWKSLFSVTQ